MRFLIILCAVTLGCAFAGWVDLVAVLTTVVFCTYCMFLLVTGKPESHLSEGVDR